MFNTPRKVTLRNYKHVKTCRKLTLLHLQNVKTVKEGIERLIDREYIERDEHQSDLLRYLS